MRTPRPAANAVLLLLPLLVACAGGGSRDASPPAATRAREADPDASAAPTQEWTPPNQIGNKAAPFSLDSVLTPGAKVALAPGKINLVQFWATWNAPAKHSFPVLQEIYLRHHASGLELAALSADDDATGVAEAARQWGATFPVAWDEGHKVAAAWKPSSMPILYLVDRHGVIRHVFRGWHDGEGDAVERALTAMLAAKE